MARWGSALVTAQPLERCQQEGKVGAGLSQLCFQRPAQQLSAAQPFGPVALFCCFLLAWELQLLSGAVALVTELVLPRQSKATNEQLFVTC